MTIINHTLGFPRVGLRRELKKAQESYWASEAPDKAPPIVTASPTLNT